MVTLESHKRLHKTINKHLVLDPIAAIMKLEEDFTKWEWSDDGIAVITKKETHEAVVDVEDNNPTFIIQQHDPTAGRAGRGQ